MGAESYIDELEKIARTGLLQYGKDFLGGIDPFGTFTSGYAQQAEREGASPGQHRLRHAVTTAGGLIGGATVVPSAIYGIAEAGRAGLAAKQGRLGAAGQGFVRGFKKPLSDLYHGLKTQRLLKDVAEGGTRKLTKDEARHLMQTVGNATINDVQGAAGAQLRRAEDIGNILSENAPRLRQQLATAQGEGRDLAEMLRRYEQLTPQSITSDPAAFATQARADLARLEQARGRLGPMYDDLKTMRGRLEPHLNELQGLYNEGQQFQQAMRGAAPLSQQTAARFENPVAEAVGTGASQLALGGGIGGYGAYIQYLKGRQAEQEAQQRIDAARMGKVASVKLAVMEKHGKPKRKKISKAALRCGAVAASLKKTAMLGVGVDVAELGDLGDAATVGVNVGFPYLAALGIRPKALVVTDKAGIEYRPELGFGLSGPYIGLSIKSPPKLKKGKKSDKKKTAAVAFLRTNRPAKVKEIYKALKRDHPDWPAGKKARIAQATYNKMRG